MEGSGGRGAVSHPPIEGLTSPAALAAAHAFGASIAPGFAFGVALAVVCRERPWPVLPVRRALWAVGLAVVATEVVSGVAGLLAAFTGWKLYGTALYPSWGARPIVVTQTI